MTQKQELEYLSMLEESESSRYESRGVFGALGHGVEVEEYEEFTLYNWDCETEFDELLEIVEPLFPLAVDPALEMIKEEVVSAIRIETMILWITDWYMTR